MANPLKLLALLGLLFVGGCAVRETQVPWPPELPPRTWFVQQWRQDDANRELQSQADYLLWVTRFYQGFNVAPGWLSMMQRVEARIPPEHWAQVRPVLQELGRSIGSEWAKDNAVRRIDTRTAATWRDALQEALSQHDLDAFLVRLQQDVSALLAGELDARLIRFERYYTDEFDF